jgi:hypothetical protein
MMSGPMEDLMVRDVYDDLTLASARLLVEAWCSPFWDFGDDSLAESQFLDAMENLVSMVRRSERAKEGKDDLQRMETNALVAPLAR